MSKVSIIAEKLLNTQCSKEVELAGVIRFPESFRVKFVTFVCCHDMTGKAGRGWPRTTPALQAQYCPAIVTHGTRIQEVTL